MTGNKMPPDRSTFLVRRIRVQVCIDFATHPRRIWNQELALKRVQDLLQTDPSIKVHEVVDLDSPPEEQLPPSERQALRNAKASQTIMEQGWVPAPVKTEEDWWHEFCAARTKKLDGTYQHLVEWYAYRHFNILLYEVKETPKSPVTYRPRVHRNGGNRTFWLYHTDNTDPAHAMRSAEKDVDRRLAAK
jgi:hypothetical protein